MDDSTAARTWNLATRIPAEDAQRCVQHGYGVPLPTARKINPTVIGHARYNYVKHKTAASQRRFWPSSKEVILNTMSMSVYPLVH
jgi:hypothetical protein